MDNAAFYNPKNDIIVMNTERPNAIPILDRTILHELGHWTGHSSRMQRKVIVNTEKQKTYSDVELENEEIIAEMICYQLGRELNILSKEWQQKSENYIATYTKGSVYDARDHVKRAVWFLLKIAAANMRTTCKL
jgi:antirestriction protein ArdC